jgi:hypothetical protein
MMDDEDLISAKGLNGESIGDFIREDGRGQQSRRVVTTVIFG